MLESRGLEVPGAAVKGQRGLDEREREGERKREKEKEACGVS